MVHQVSLAIGYWEWYVKFGLGLRSLYILNMPGFIGRSLLVLLITFCADGWASALEPSAAKGVMDLSNPRDWGKAKSIKLSGEWEFYWDIHYHQWMLKLGNAERKAIKEARAYHTFPSSWTSLQDNDGNYYPAFGKATYRLKVIIPPSFPMGDLGLCIPKTWCAQQTWVNGKLISQRGNVTEHRYQNMILEDLVKISSKTQTLDITIQMANYSLFIGGMVEPLEIGSYKYLSHKKEQTNFFLLGLMGSLLIIGIYHILFFVFRPKDLALLLFAILSLLVFLKLAVFGDHYLYEYLKLNDIMDFELQSALYYFSTDMMVAIGLRYVSTLFPADTYKRACNTLFYLIMAVAFFMLLSPNWLHTPVIVPSQVLIISGALYTVWVVIRASIRRREGAYWQLVGIGIVVFSGLNDALYTENIKLTGIGETMHLAFLLLTLIQLVILSKRSATAFAKLESLTGELEAKVGERTQEVIAQKEQIERQNHELIHANISLQEKNMEKENLMHVMAHDLKSPMGRIRGLVEILRIADSPEEEKEYLAVIEQVAIDAESMVISILEQASQGTDHTEQYEDIALCQLVKDRVAQHHTLAKRKGLTILAQVADEEIHTKSIKLYLNQILDNLLSNCIKYSPSDTIITVSLSQATDSSIHLSVKDQGQGFSEEDKTSLYQKFKTLSATPTDNESATGLGLSIVKKLVDRLGGEITLESQPGHGSEFRITLS